MNSNTFSLRSYSRRLLPIPRKFSITYIEAWVDSKFTSFYISLKGLKNSILVLNLYIQFRGCRFNPYIIHMYSAGMFIVSFGVSHFYSTSNPTSLYMGLRDVKCLLDFNYAGSDLYRVICICKTRSIIHPSSDGWSWVQSTNGCCLSDILWLCMHMDVSFFALSSESRTWFNKC